MAKVHSSLSGAELHNPKGIDALNTSTALVMSQSAQTIHASSSILPNAQNTYDLGSATRAWKTAYISTGSLKFVNPGNNSVVASISASADGNFDFGNAQISGSANSTGSFGRLEVAGNTNLTGDITVGGNLTLGDAASDSVSISADLTSHLIPNADATYDLGSSSQGWNDLHLGSGGVINLDGGDVTLTHSANTITVAGGTLAAAAITGTTIDASTDFTIGSTVITDDSIVMTPSTSDTVTIAGATNGILNITTVDAAGTAGDINVTADGQIEFRANDAAGHIFDINGTNQVSIIDGSILPISNNDIDLGSDAKEFKDIWIDGTAYLDTVDIDAGAIDGTTIGANSAAAGTFGAIVGTTLSATGDVDLGNATSDTITATGRFDSDIVPSTDSARDLGTSALQFAEAHIDTGHIDDITATGTSTLTTVDINGGAIDGTTIGASSAAAGTFTNLTVTTDVNIDDSGGDGAMDGVIIGASSAAAGTFTTLNTTGLTTIGDASGDSLVINAATINPANIAAGTDNSVVVYNGSTLVTDEIDSRVWGSTLVDTDGSGTNNELVTWSDSDTIIGEGNLTFNGSVLAVTGDQTISDTLSVTNSITGSIVSASTGQFTSITGVTTLTAGGNLDIGAHDLRAATITADGLSSGRVVFAGTAGVLSDDSDLTFSGDTLTATKIGAFTLSGKLTAGSTEIEGSAFDIDGGDIASGVTINKSPVVNFNSGDVQGSITLSNLASGTGALTIQADSVEHSMINDNLISGFSNLGSAGVAQGDEFLFSDNGTLKALTFSNLEDTIFGNVSGDATIAAGGALTIGAGAVENSMLANSTISGVALGSNLNSLSITANGGIGMTSYNGSAAVSNLALDIDGMTDIGAAIVDADLLIIDDGANGTNRKATMSRLKSYMGDISGGSTLGNVQVGVTAGGEIDTSSGNLTIDSAGGTITLDDHVTISGNLTVNGGSTVVSSSLLDIGDRIITLNANSAAGDGGLYVNDADSAETGSLLWDVSEDRWVGGLKGAEANVVLINTTDTLTNKTLTSPDINTPDIDGGTVDGATIATSDITVGSGKTLDVSGGTLTLAADQISGNAINGGTIGSTTITSLTTSGITIGGHTVDDIDITSEASDADDHLMTAAAIKARIDDLKGVTSNVAGTGISVSGATGAVTISTNDGQIVHDSLSGFVANEHIDHSGVDLTAGSGMTGGGTIAASRTFNVIGGDGITANANDVAVTAAQTTITSVVNSSLEIGRDADNRIKFGTDNQIIFEVDGGDNVVMKTSGEIEATSLDISGDVDVDGTLETDALTIGGVTSVPFESADHSKLDGIEASADVTDTANVTAAGALMDSECTDLAAVKATEDAFTAALKSKLDGIEASATADQTITSGTGMTGGGSGDITLNVVGGDGITANANDMAITPAQTTITGIHNTSLQIGRDSHNEFDFSTDNVIKVSVDAVDDEFRFAAGGTFHADADVVAYSSTTASDISLKKNITDTKYGLDDIMKLRGVDYDWKREDMGHDVGVLAQEVEAVIPEIVKEYDGMKGREKFKAVDYNKLVPVLIESIKELKFKLDEQEAIINDIKSIELN